MPSKAKFEEQKAQQAPISLESACSALTELWSPRVVGQVNNQYIKVAKVLGEFPWHGHEHEDEMFLVLRGVLCIGRAEADGGPVSLRPGEFFVVPRGVRHNTSAVEETWIALIETVTTLHYGLGTDPADAVHCRPASPNFLEVPVR